MPCHSDQLDELRDRAATNLAYHSARTVAGEHSPPQAPAMFVVTEAEAASIGAIFEQRGEFAAAVELRRRFPGIASTAQARECARIMRAGSRCRSYRQHACIDGRHTLARCGASRLAG
jgi:hypothetical protein